MSPVAPGKVAVVTGAASGIGLGLSERFAAEGMHVVMADVEEPALAKAASALAGNGASVLPVLTDVADPAAVDALRDSAVAAFGAVHVVCNNAGVGGPHGALWECPPGEWDWVLGVNLGGVINGVRTFMPLLLEQDAGHMVNTSSIFGVFAGTLGPYGVSKHAVAALTETLYFNLKSLGVSHVGVSVLCPGAVRTNFGTSARNRPSWAGPPVVRGEAEQESAERFDRLTATGASPAEVAAIVVDGIRARRFYLLTSENRNEAVTRRGEEIVAGGPPEPPVSFV
ncbi:MAG: SDR family NAD(P)-dependent oxidoreductase [Trebonia sp.]|uniref:SDR family NAD(P)-dependent oxidoreductase n=1 Tax=Trebonia sp. TaxID=2767075 RepID=UPI003BB2072E